MYKVSKDYERLKKLLDSGKWIICFVDTKVQFIDVKGIGFRYRRCVTDIYRVDDVDYPGQYFYLLGSALRVCHYSSRSNIPAEEQWKLMDLSFIDPDYSKNVYRLFKLDIKK